MLLHQFGYSHWLRAGMSVWLLSLGMTPVHGAVCGFAAGEREKRQESQEAGGLLALHQRSRAEEQWEVK